jgi:hypothetical protein
MIDTRKSPSIHASETPIGTIKKGNNGAYWIVLATSSQIHRWNPLSLTKPKKLDTIYNGEIMNVIIGDPSIYIFHNQSLVFSISKYNKLWIPKREWMVEPIGKNKRLPPKENTLLIEVKPKQYIYIDGHIIYKFETDTPIISYHSPMGNSFVPYVFAYTIDRVYLIIENVWLEWSSDLKKKYKDPYEYFYKLTPKSHKYSIKTVYDAWKK